MLSCATQSVIRFNQHAAHIYWHILTVCAIHSTHSTVPVRYRYRYRYDTFDFCPTMYSVPCTVTCFMASNNKQARTPVRLLYKNISLHRKAAESLPTFHFILVSIFPYCSHIVLLLLNYQSLYF